jgi:hypothetical protein
VGAATTIAAHGFGRLGSLMPAMGYGNNPSPRLPAIVLILIGADPSLRTLTGASPAGVVLFGADPALRTLTGASPAGIVLFGADPSLRILNGGP